jgi:hypothetical protein
MNFIDLTTLRSPPNIPVERIDDWFTFVQSEFADITGQVLPVTQAYLESSTDLNKYTPNPLVALHAELGLAIWRTKNNKRGGKIGVSKRCCMTCMAGLTALRREGSCYSIKGSHAKPYVDRLSGTAAVDIEIVKAVKETFDDWLLKLNVLPDPDVSSAGAESYGESYGENSPEAMLVSDRLFRWMEAALTVTNSSTGICPPLHDLDAPQADQIVQNTRTLRPSNTLQ